MFSMNEKRFTYTTRIISDKKAYYKDYILDKETLLNTEQIVAILNAQDDYINYVTKERNIACNKLDKQQATIKSKDKQLERLYNYFQDYLKDEMSGNAFSEMWDFVKEDEKWEDE